jgi:hypothetical protein
MGPIRDWVRAILRVIRTTNGIGFAAVPGTAEVPPFCRMAGSAAAASAPVETAVRNPGINGPL